MVALPPLPTALICSLGQPRGVALCLIPGGGGEDQETEELPGVLHWGHLLQTSPDKKIFKYRVKKEKSRSCFPSVTIEFLAPQLQPQLQMFPHSLKGKATTPSSCVPVSRAAPLQGTQPLLPLTAHRASGKAPLQPQPFREDVLALMGEVMQQPPHLGFLL